MSVGLICVLAWSSLGLSYMGLSMLPGLECFLSHVREILGYNLFHYFLRTILFLFSFWDPYDANVGAFNVVPEVSFLLIFFLYSVLWQWFPPPCLLAHLFIHLPQLFCNWFLLVYFSFQLLHCLSLFFKSSSSLLNISCIFSVCASILFLRFCIIFIIITLNSFSGRLPISSSFSCSCLKPISLSSHFV